MADTKLSAITAATVVTTDDLVYVVDDPAGTPVEKKGTVAQLLAAGGVPAGGRITLATADSAPAADQTAKTTIYYTPHAHDKVLLPLATSGWEFVTFTELSQATTDSTKSPAAVAADTCYDLFVWSDSGTIRCTRGPAWSTNTVGACARGTGAGTTELISRNGVWINKVAITNGPGAERGLYVGSIRSTSASQAEDSYAYRGIWNQYNAVPRAFRKNDATSHSYNGGYRQWRATTANRCELMVGQAGQGVTWGVEHECSNGGGLFAIAGASINATTATAGVDAVCYTKLASDFRVSGQGAAVLPLGFNQINMVQSTLSGGSATYNGCFLSGVHTC